MQKMRALGWFLAGAAFLLIVMLIFTKSQVDTQGEFLCKEVAEDPTMEMEDCPAHNSPVSWLLFISFGIGFLMLGTGIYFGLNPSTQKQDITPADTSRLDEQERRIHALLKERGGSAYQSDLIKELDISKVKMTRILDKMELKGILERKRRGMTNIIVLR